MLLISNYIQYCFEFLSPESKAAHSDSKGNSQQIGEHGSSGRSVAAFGEAFWSQPTSQPSISSNISCGRWNRSSAWSAAAAGRKGTGGGSSRGWTKTEFDRCVGGICDKRRAQADAYFVPSLNASASISSMSPSWMSIIVLRKQVPKSWHVLLKSCMLLTPMAGKMYTVCLRISVVAVFHIDSNSLRPFVLLQYGFVAAPKSG